MIRVAALLQQDPGAAEGLRPPHFFRRRRRMVFVEFVKDDCLEVRHLDGVCRLGVRTKDIGSTIGVEIFWWETGRRIAAYQAGTRHMARATQLVVDLVAEAFGTIKMNSCNGEPVEWAIRSHEDVASRPWNPEEK